MSQLESVFQRCGCRDATTRRQLNEKCPGLTEPEHGSWYFTAYVPTMTGGRTRVRRGGYGSRGAAEQARLELLAMPENRAAGQTLTLQRWLGQWLTTIEGQIRPTTMRSYREHVHNYLIPAIGHIELANLRACHVQAAFLNIGTRRTTSGRLLAASTQNRIRATLRSALSEAVRQDFISLNPASRIRLPKPYKVHPVLWTAAREAEWRATGVRPAVAVWTRQQLVAFLKTIRNDPHFALWWLVALTGLRRGEVAALRWTDIDLHDATLTVKEQIVVVDGQDVVGPPKSASSCRTIALDATTLRLLRNEWRLHHRVLRETGRNPDGYLFVNAKGQPLRPDYLTRRLGKLIANADLPPVRLHDLRHGAASLALAAGVDLKVVQHLLGDSSIITTADIYTTVLSEASRNAAEATASFILDAARTRLSLGGASQA
ncbi:site-specific integrase [Micromonospora ureilytica]|uniref:tyrosine-type recombinase/integrase n=1 Tax=Micromonospora ureilytica TaxID=709868 RepID=UPI002E15259A|nr:site-specific integrase [Micromonospora ureilytica]